MKGLLLGIAFILLVGIGGLVYRNALEHPQEPIACPLDARVCPDGTSVGREGSSCTFSACPAPNVTLESADLVFALPEGFAEAPAQDTATIADYRRESEGTTSAGEIILRHYPLTASSTPLAAIQETAVDAFGKPVGATAFSSKVLGPRRFTVVAIDRYDGTVVTAYYLARGSDLLRFDAIDSDVTEWNDQNLETATLPTHKALEALLTTLQSS